jgi:hypothetical protein
VQDHQQNGQRARRPDPETSVIGNLALAAAIVTALGGPILVAGLVVAMCTSYKVGPYGGFAAGLTAIVVGALLIHGGMGLICDRLHAKDLAMARIEVRELNRNVRTVVAMLSERATSADDQVGAARRSHEN